MAATRGMEIKSWSVVRQSERTHREATQEQLRATLRQRIAEIERSGATGTVNRRGNDSARFDGVTAPLPFGVPDIDTHLPWGGLPVIGVHDIIETGPGGAMGTHTRLHGQMGGSATAFIAVLLGALQRRGTHFDRVRPVLWIAPRRPSHENLYGPGLTAFGYDPFDARAGLILVRAGSATQILWAMEEGLREPQLGAVIAEMPPGVLPSLTASRRLQLAAEAGETLGLLHGGHCVGQTASIVPPSASFTRWRITSAASPMPEPTGLESTGPEPTGRRSGTDPPLYQERPRWRVELLRCRGAAPRQWTLDWSPANWNSVDQRREAGQEMQKEHAKKFNSKNKKNIRTTCNFSMVAPIQNRSDPLANALHSPHIKVLTG